MNNPPYFRPMTDKPDYTVCGNKEFDMKIEKDMKLIADKFLASADVKDIAAIILGGGYGRGEGGVAFKNGMMHLYNDYDMFIISESISCHKKKIYGEKLRELSRELTELIGIDVDFAPVRNRNELTSMPFTLMNYELKEGHKVIYGDTNILKAMPDYKAEMLPMEEPLKLMLNRGTGLILAEGKLSQDSISEEDNMFIERNIYKAIMACGDVYLMAHKRYNSSYLKRLDIINEFSGDSMLTEDGFLESYRESIFYKLSPENNFSANRDKHKYAKMIYRKFYLYIFGFYWGCRLNSFKDYYDRLESAGIGPGIGGLKSLIKNIVLNSKEIGFSNFNTRFFINYPRLRLFYAQPFFLFDMDYCSRCYLPGVLGCRGRGDEELRNRFIRIWNRFN